MRLPPLVPPPPHTHTHKNTHTLESDNTMYYHQDRNSYDYLPKACPSPVYTYVETTGAE